MATITLTFAKDINKSVQIGDTIYRCTMSGTVASDPIEIGTIIEIADREATPTVKVYSTIAGWSGTQNRFIFFSKDNKANLSSPLGYFASVKLVNDSTTEAELHAVGMDIFASSA